MKVIAFHPEDLLDRELCGTLSPEERARLEEHLARCQVCRLERQLRVDFAAELAQQSGAHDVQLFVAGALQSAQDRPREAVLEASAQPRRPPARRARALLLALAATLTLGTGLALGQEGWAEQAWRAVGRRIGGVFAPAADSSAPRALRRRPAPLALPALPTAETTAPAVALPPVQPLPSQAPARARKAQGERGASDPARAAGARAARLFEHANRARRQGDAVEAVMFYRELQARFAETAEARLSLALVARMQLDRGEPSAALSGFEAYLATSDRALRAEAMAGRALALAQLGRTRLSEQAFAEFLRAFPDSGYAALARRRLAGGERP